MPAPMSPIERMATVASGLDAMIAVGRGLLPDFAGCLVANIIRGGDSPRFGWRCREYAFDGGDVAHLQSSGCIQATCRGVNVKHSIIQISMYHARLRYSRVSV